MECQTNQQLKSKCRIQTSFGEFLLDLDVQGSISMSTSGWAFLKSLITFNYLRKLGQSYYRRLIHSLSTLASRLVARCFCPLRALAGLLGDLNGDRRHAGVVSRFVKVKLKNDAVEIAALGISLDKTQMALMMVTVKTSSPDYYNLKKVLRTFYHLPYCDYVSPPFRNCEQHSLDP